MSLNIEKIIQTQKELSNLIGCPGHEEEIAEYLINKLQELGVENAWIDPLGNVLGIKEGKKEDGLRILLDAHIDEVGFMINHIEENGFIRVDTLGGIDKRIMLGQLLQFQADDRSRVIGVVGTHPPHVTKSEERDKIPEIMDLFVDIGASSVEEVLSLGLHVGSVGTFYTEFRKLNDKMLLGKGFDDRTACNVILQVLELLKNKEIDNTILINFAVQEEVGGRGATTGAYALEPHMALAIENTIATDVPEVPPRKIVTKLGNGPAITAADRSLIVSKKILARLMEAAEMDNIPWQYKKPTYGGTDAGRIAITRQGVLAGVVSVPCRYIHSNAGILNVDDLVNTIKLVHNFLVI